VAHRVVELEQQLVQGCLLGFLYLACALICLQALHQSKG
jgi:hypothetical protein